jgi:predicted AlkP superfamily phosphohydrolase/phosphomutase
VGDEIAAKKSRKVLARHRDKQILSLRRKTDAILWLMKEFEWQFFLTAYYEGHRAGHNLWPIWEEFSSDPPEHAMLDVYRELDTQFGRILAALDLSDTTVVLFSMHGMTAGYAQDHFLEPVMNRVNSLYAEANGDSVKPGRRSIARILRQTVPASLQLHIREWVGQRIQDWLVDREFRGGKDWKHTPAFPVPGGGDIGFIRFNIVGRERDGCLPPSEEGRGCYVDFLCRHLLGLRVKETNEPLIRKIVMAEQAFPGPRSYLLPDIMLVWQPKSPAKEIWSTELGCIRASLKTGRGGNHTGDSFAIITGVGEPDQLPPLHHVSDFKKFVFHLLRVKDGAASLREVADAPVQV